MLHFLNLLFLLCLVLSRVYSLNFNFSSFDTNPVEIILDWDATFYGSTIYLTKNPSNGPISDSVGKALYKTSMQLWDQKGSTTNFADFTAHFSFKISNVTGYPGTGDGFAFLLVPEDADWVPDRVFAGGLLGLFESTTAALNGTARNPVVAIEFDTSKNDWDPIAQNHIGIDVNSIKSIEYLSVALVDQGIGNVLVSYVSSTMTLSASLSFAGSSGSFGVSHTINLSSVLPQMVKVGFTAASAQFVEVHQLYSWSFSSSTGGEDVAVGVPSPSPFASPPPGHPPYAVIGTVVGVFVFISAAIGVIIWCCLCRSRRNVLAEVPLVDTEIHLPEDQEPPPQTIVIVTQDHVGPKSFSYHELYEATKGFADELKLGMGACGDVYEGILGSTNETVAIKKFKPTLESDQSIREKEYVSELNAISTLRHKNLVQLKGWCHENQELLIVYEFMPNRSLDYHLFGKNMPLLTWPTRYKIALGLATALNYLQNEADQQVIHRDIKSGNIMLDDHFNVKLGDFGLARFSDHGKSINATGGAWTEGYVAPELALSGKKATKASDVYSFGIVSLELATGKRAIISRQDGGLLVDWVLDNFREDTLIDERLKKSEDFNESEARRLIMIGLNCSLPDPTQRPFIDQVKLWLTSNSTPIPVPRVKRIMDDYLPDIDFSPGPSHYQLARIRDETHP